MLKAFLLALRNDHRAHRRDPVRLEEHVLRPAQTHSLGAKASSDGGLLRSVRVGEDLFFFERYKNDTIGNTVGFGPRRGGVAAECVLVTYAGDTPYI